MRSRDWNGGGLVCFRAGSISFCMCISKLVAPGPDIRLHTPSTLPGARTAPLSYDFEPAGTYHFRYHTVTPMCLGGILPSPPSG